jgi:hypothetical protein
MNLSFINTFLLIIGVYLWLVPERQVTHQQTVIMTILWAKGALPKTHTDGLTEYHFG